jgi:glucose-6-phosphate isomerase
MDKSKSWSALKAHQKIIEKQHLKTVFTDDQLRFGKYSITAGGILLDYSKNRINSTTMGLLGDLAIERNLEQKIKAMFEGQKINTSEGRAVLHTALRQRSDKPIRVDGEDVMVEVKQTLAKMETFCADIHSGKRSGYLDNKFTDIVCLGIGGSFLGPKIVVESLKQYRKKECKLHFVANVDGYHLYDVLSELNIATTLVIIASKSFSTEETMLNARTTRQWLLSEGLSEEELKQHIVAISSNITSAMEFGVDVDNIFPMWDWVGGRYSLWSAIGLPIALAVGFEHFNQLLQGASEMDEHFATTPFHSNMPVTLALLGLWNINIWGATSHCIIPYCHYLRGLPAHIQQLDMESNGKSVSVDGEPLNYLTGPAIWGSEGVNSQHAFFQQIHQSNSLYPVDFIIPLNVNHPYQEHHDMLVSHCFAQSQALMQGKTRDQAYDELINSGYSEQRSHELAPHKAMAGNKPNNVLIMDDLSPHRIGALLALYEHKVVVQGMLWNINSFDQWGVELGKQLSKPVYESLISGSSGVDQTARTKLDCSTAMLIKTFVARRDK